MAEDDEDAMEKEYEAQQRAEEEEEEEARQRLIFEAELEQHGIYSFFEVPYDY